MRFVTLILSLLAFVAAPATAAASPDLVSVEQQLRSMLSDTSADVGIAALDLNTGESISIKGDTPFPMASTVKVAIAALYLSQVDDRQKTLDDKISGVPVRTLMAKMLIHSDNHAADVLFKDVGGPRAVHHWLVQNGIHGVRVDRTIAQLLAAKRDLWDVRDSSTPKAMVELLRRIYRGELISAQSRNYLLAEMAKCQTGRNRMKWLLPEGTPVEHKTGTLNGLTDDVGFITMPDGHRIAVAIFARGGSNRPRTIAQAARAIYDGFKTIFSWPYRPALTAQ
ncbi:serine hydrolase [Sphingomonas segetis]|jgi:beta-lactamase class A|uniref:serine hydrolase n=1 Tax=Sphingomonas segetis TaxID=1104779 RepID=UPI0012D2BE1F|nr:serine hydrolase [Sphingomonas segetis]